MKIKHIEFLSESLDRRVQLDNSGSMPEGYDTNKNLIAYHRIEGNQVYLTASNYYVNDNEITANTLWSANKINSELQNASFGLSSAVLPPVENTASLKTVYSSSLQLVDRAFILVEDQGLYRWDEQSETDEDGYKVIKDPNINIGRWFKISLSTDLYMRKPSAGGSIGNLLQFGSTSDQVADSGLSPIALLQKGPVNVSSTSAMVMVTPAGGSMNQYASGSNLAIGSIVKRNTSANHTAGSILVSGDGAANYASGSNILIQNVVLKRAGSADDIAFFDSTGSIVHLDGYNLASYVSGTNEQTATGNLAIYDYSGGVLKSSYISVNSIVTASVAETTYVAGYDASRNAISQSSVEINNLVVGSAIENDNATSYIAVYDSSGKLVQKSPHQQSTYVEGVSAFSSNDYPIATFISTSNAMRIYQSSKKISDLAQPLYTVTLMRSDVTAGPGGYTIDMYSGSALPYPVDKSRMLNVSVAGIVYASSSDDTPLNEQYYVSTLNATTFNLILSSSYTVESEETVLVSYLSYTSSI